MILTVSFERTTYNDLPYKFEAGTPNIAGAVGLGAAVDYLERIGLDGHRRARARAARLRYARGCSTRSRACASSAPRRHKAGVLSFVLDGVHPHDLGTILDHEGVAIRTGHHCAMPLMERFGVPATARASFALLQQARRRRPLDRRARQRAGGVPWMTLTRPVSRGDPRSQPQPAQFRRARRCRCAWPTGTIRCAATSSRST